MIWFCLNNMGGLLIFASIPFTALLHNSAARLSNPCPMGAEHIYKREKYISVLVS